MSLRPYCKKACGLLNGFVIVKLAFTLDCIAYLTVVQFDGCFSFISVKQTPPHRELLSPAEVLFHFELQFTECCFIGSSGTANYFFFLIIATARVMIFQSSDVPETDTAAVASGLETLTLSLIAVILPASSVVLSVSVKIKLPSSSMRQPLIPMPSLPSLPSAPSLPSFPSLPTILPRFVITPSVKVIIRLPSESM